MGNPEMQPTTTESLNGTQEAAGKQREKLKLLEASVEHGNEHEQRHSAEKAVEAVFSKESSGAERKSASLDGDSVTRPAPKSFNKAERNVQYSLTMKRVQQQMNPAEKTFSRAIHNQAVEKASDAVGSSLARPNAILAGSFTAFVLVAAVYVIARSMGYRLSGFETIGAFILGWAIGMIFDYTRLMIRGKN